MPAMPGVRAVIDDLLTKAKMLSTREVAALAGVSRQAAQKQLKKMVQSGALKVEGRARAARYFPKAQLNSGPDLWSKVRQLADALHSVDNPGIDNRQIVNPERLAFHAQAQLPASPRAAPAMTAWPRRGKRRAAQVALSALRSAPASTEERTSDLGARTLRVASAGSLYRLSARQLLEDVAGQELTLDFTGVHELGDEFVEELGTWALAHPATKVQVENLDPTLAPRLAAITSR
jgi:hypothetical protein